MNKLDFSNTTLVMIDGTGTSFDENEKIINQMSKICNFFSIKHFTVSKTNSNISEIIFLKNNLSYEDYQRFCIFEVNKHITTDFAFYMQSDGFIINPTLFDREYFEYDYIGSPWPKKTFSESQTEHLVGNGGFSLRSKKFLNLCANIPQTNINEDFLLCVIFKEYFINNGCKFAPAQLAKKFGLEIQMDESHTLNNVFGFHGKGHLKKAKEMLSIS